MIKDKYPNMPKSQINLVINTLLGCFEHILEAGEDVVCEEIIEEKIDLSIYPNVKKRVDEYLANK